MADLLSSVAELAEERRAATDDDHKARWGQYFTPPAVATFMAGWLTAPRPQGELVVLDPGAGTGLLGIAAARALLVAGAAAVHVVAVEADPLVVPLLERALAAARSELGERFRATVRAEDFLALERPRLGVAPLPDVDVVIANPPYFKMSPTDPHGGTAPNAYARFMAVSSAVLRPGGQLVFIVPRSFASGFYYQRFRRELHDELALERAHVFGSRRDAFRSDDVLQENIVVGYRRAPPAPTVQVSSSMGVGDLAAPRVLHVSRDQVLRPKDTHGVLHLPTTAEDLEVMQTVYGWGGSLRALGLEISTGPVVPFRSAEDLVHEASADTVPMLWMQHVRHGAVRWPVEGLRKPQHVRRSAGDKLLVPNRTYLLLRRFSAKEEPRRLTVAVLRAGELPGDRLGLENHLNFIHRPGGELDEELALGLAALLGSTLLDTFFRLQSGNTQVSATELRALPLPAEEVLRALGRAVVASGGEQLTDQVGLEGRAQSVDVLVRSPSSVLSVSEGAAPHFGQPGIGSAHGL